MSKKHTTAAGKPPRKCCSLLEAQQICRVARSAAVQFRDSEQGSMEEEVALATLWSFIDSYEQLLRHTPRSIAVSAATTLQARSHLVDLGLTNTRNLLSVHMVEEYEQKLTQRRNDCRDEMLKRDLGIRLDEARRMLTFLRAAGDANTQEEVLNHDLRV